MVPCIKSSGRRDTVWGGAGQRSRSRKMEGKGWCVVVVAAAVEGGRCGRRTATFIKESLRASAYDLFSRPCVGTSTKSGSPM